jgi:hypothetical protein
MRVLSFLIALGDTRPIRRKLSNCGIAFFFGMKIAPKANRS